MLLTQIESYSTKKLPPVSGKQLYLFCFYKSVPSPALHAAPSAGEMEEINASGSCLIGGIVL